MSQKRQQKGQALLMALIFLLALTFLGFGLISIATLDINSSRNMRLSEEAMSAAEEGALFALNYVPNHMPTIMAAANHTITIDSVTQGGKLATNRLQYRVTLSLGAAMSPPPGYTTKALFNELVVQSTGSVADSQGFAFGAGSTSIIERRVEVLARVQTGYEE